MAAYLAVAIRGLAAGLIIAAPVGPVNLLCIRRTLQNGWKSGVVSGLGAALADTVYGAISVLGINLVIQFVLREELWIRVIGGIILTGIGVAFYCRPPRPLEAVENDSSANSDLASAFLLNATNATMVLSFPVVLAALGVGRQQSLLQTSVLVAGIFFGSMIWWNGLALASSRLRSLITSRTMRWVNHVAGIVIAGIGLVNVLLGCWKGH